MVLLVGVKIEVVGHLIVPVDRDAQRVEGVEARVGVTREEVAVRPGGTAEDKALELQVAETGDQLHVLEQVGQEIDDQGVGILRRGVEGLDHGPGADRAGLALEQFLQFLVVGADDHGAVLHRGALAADSDLGLRAGLAGVVRRIIVQALVQALGRAEQALAALGEGFGLGVLQGWRAKNLHRDHGVHHRLVALVIDLQHDIRAKGLQGVEQHGTGMQAEIALAGIQHDEVLLQVHGATREDAGVRGD